jgi:hypothetical protein
LNLNFQKASEYLDWLISHDLVHEKGMVFIKPHQPEMLFWQIWPDSAKIRERSEILSRPCDGIKK